LPTLKAKQNATSITEKQRQELLAELPVQELTRRGITVDSPRFGLPNPSILCYVNSTMQLIMTIPAVLTEAAKRPAKDMLATFAKAIFLEKASANDIRRIKEDKIDSVLPSFKGNDQQDPSEFLIQLLDNNAGLRFLTNSVLVEWRRVIECPCGETVLCEKEIDTRINIVPTCDVETGIRNFFPQERLERRCGNIPSCGSEFAWSRFVVTKSSEFLFVTRDLFTNAGIKHPQRRKTIEREIHFGPEMQNYKLISVISHVGLTKNRGHYLTYIINGANIQCFNDEYESIPEVDHGDPYVLLYKATLKNESLMQE